MKIIIVGGTGLVATELIKQSLPMPEITSIVALSRRPVYLEDAVNKPKFKSVVLRDYEEYPDSVKAELSGADACIW
jgi:dTDP-4-dehydrorhamnose reductase